MNIVGKQKKLTPEIFIYVLEMHFYEFQGQSKGHKVKYLKITWN